MKPTIQLYEDRKEPTDEDLMPFFVRALPGALIGSMVLFGLIVFLCFVFS